MQIVDIQYNLNENIGVLTAFLTMSRSRSPVLLSWPVSPYWSLVNLAGFLDESRIRYHVLLLDRALETFPFRKGDDEVIGVFNLLGIHRR